MPLTMKDFSEEYGTLKNFDDEMTEIDNRFRLNSNEESPVTHIKAHILIPIKEILEQKLRSDEE